MGWLDRPQSVFHRPLTCVHYVSEHLFTMSPVYTAFMKQPRIASMVQNVLLGSDGECYRLSAWVVMPNHLHVLFKVGNKPMGRVIADWKEYTAREANKLLGRRGKFWADDYWDTFMRDQTHELSARQYAEKNPVKAGLARVPGDWPWSSARFRDDFGRLVL